MKSVSIESLAPACVEVTAVAGCCFVFYIAAHQVLSGSISAGQLTSFIAAILLAYQPLKKLINVYSDIQYGLAAADRVFALMDKHWPTLENRTMDHELSVQSLTKLSLLLMVVVFLRRA